MHAVGRPAAVLLASAAAIELAVALFTLAIGGFQIDAGPLRVRSTDALKPFTIAALLGSASAWLFHRLAPETASWEAAPSWLRRLLTIGVAAGSFLALASPLLMPGFPFGHDLGTHLTYTYLFDRALWQGQFPVRWVESVVNGQGQALFNYYQVGVYYLVQVVHLAVPSLAVSLKATVLGLWCAGAWFTYLLFRRLGRAPAAAAALAFAWAPYLHLDVYVRAAYAELSTIALFPALLWAVDRYLRSGRPRFWIAVPPLLCLVLIGHLPALMILGPLGLGYVAALLLARETPVRRAAALAPAAICGLAMAAFYLWPAIAERDAVAIGRLTSGYQDYRAHFLHPAQWFDPTPGYGPSRPGAEGEMPFHVGIVVWLALAGTILLLALPRLSRSNEVRRWEPMFWLLAAAVALFLTTEASAAIWALVAPLAFLQFPWRALMVVPLAGAALAGYLVSRAGSRTTQVLLVGAIAVAGGYEAADQLRLARLTPREDRGIDTADWAASENARRTAFIDAGFDPVDTISAPSPPSGRWRIVSGNGVLAGEVTKDHELIFTAATDEDMRVAIHSRYMPGWRVRIDGRDAPVAVHPEYGFLEIAVPPGTHRIHARFENTPTRAAANSASAVAMGLWIAGVAALIVRRARRRGRRTPATDVA
jgi:hypothetical protein